MLGALACLACLVASLVKPGYFERPACRPLPCLAELDPGTQAWDPLFLCNRLYLPACLPAREPPDERRCARGTGHLELANIAPALSLSLSRPTHGTFPGCRRALPGPELPEATVAPRLAPDDFQDRSCAGLLRSSFSCVQVPREGLVTSRLLLLEVNASHLPCPAFFSLGCATSRHELLAIAVLHHRRPNRDKRMER